jgi:hypothetical protein
MVMVCLRYAAPPFSYKMMTKLLPLHLNYLPRYASPNQNYKEFAAVVVTTLT